MHSDTQLLPRHSTKQVRENVKQYYVDSQGAKLPSVTTILNATKPQQDRERLLNWRQRVGVAEANQISGAASRRGTGTHKQIQRYLEGKDSPCPEAILPYWQSLNNFRVGTARVTAELGFQFCWEQCLSYFREPCCKWCKM
jgi:genome maintenance exonuclease 1